MPGDARSVRQRQGIGPHRHPPAEDHTHPLPEHVHSLPEHTHTGLAERQTPTLVAWKAADQQFPHLSEDDLRLDTVLENEGFRPPVAVVNKQRANDVVTLTTAIPHGLAALDTFTTSGIGSGLDLTSGSVNSVPSPTTFTYVRGGADVPSQPSTGTVKDILFLLDASGIPGFTGRVRCQKPMRVQAIGAVKWDAGDVGVRTTHLMHRTPAGVVTIYHDPHDQAGSGNWELSNLVIANFRVAAGDTIYLNCMTQSDAATDRWVVSESPYSPRLTVERRGP